MIITADQLARDDPFYTSCMILIKFGGSLASEHLQTGHHQSCFILKLDLRLSDDDDDDVNIIQLFAWSVKEQQPIGMSAVCPRAKL